MHSDFALSPRAAASLTWGLALFLIANAFALNGALWLGSKAAGLDKLPAEQAVNYHGTVLQHSWDVLHGRGCDDSWGIMTFAYEYAESPHTTPLYTEIFFNRKLKFQYPLSSLFAIAAMVKIAGREHMRTDECQVFDVPPINDFLGWGFIFITAAASAALLEIGLRRRGVASSAGMVAARVAIVAGLTLTFYPVVKAFTLGQIQLWINGVFALALLGWALGHRAASGAFIGLMCLIKPHYGLFIVWGLLRREWRFAFGCAAMVVAGVGASFAVYGWTDNVDYLKVFWFLSQRGEAYYPNQSVNGLLSRLMSLADPVGYKNVDFDDNSFPPFNLWVYGPVLLTSLIVVAAALFRRGTTGDPDRRFDFATMALSITMASPIAWEHHYGIVFPIFAVLLAGAIGQRSRLVWLAASYVLISNFIPAANLLAYTAANFVQSYLFAGALILLVLLHRARPGLYGVGSMGAPGVAAPLKAAA
jgi:alpha-1,2-mannosyltransferase